MNMEGLLTSYERLNESLAHKTLSELKVLLTDTEVMKKKYRLELRVGSPPESSQSTAPDSHIDATGVLGILDRVNSEEGRMEILVRGKAIQSGNTTWNKFWWAVWDRKKFEELLKKISYFVQRLYDLLDSLQQKTLSSELKSVLTTVISMARRIDELHALNFALASSERRTASVATSVRLKALRLELKDDETASCDEQLRSMVERLQLLTPPLSSDLLTGFSSKSSASTMGVARYDNKPVFVERKAFPEPYKSNQEAR
jgi:Prion-inhibition and propagation